MTYINLENDKVWRLYMFNVDKEKCIACKQCINDCPVSDITLEENKANIKNKSCIKCGHCIAICPTKAVSTNHYNMEDVIEYNNEEDIFVHYSAIELDGYKTLSEGDIVRYELLKTEKGLQAQRVLHVSHD